MNYCQSCFYWVCTSNDGMFGECHRRSPIPKDDVDTTRAWPKTFDADWCGEYENRQTRLAENEKKRQ